MPTIDSWQPLACLPSSTAVSHALICINQKLFCVYDGECGPFNFILYDLIQVQPLLQNRPTPGKCHLCSLWGGPAWVHWGAELSLPLTSPDAEVQCGVDTAGNKHSFPEKKKRLPLALDGLCSVDEEPRS